MADSVMRTTLHVPLVELPHQDYVTGSALYVPPDECRIHRLPFDLLSPIFRMLCDEDALLKDALHYSRVCKLWRETFENTTAFWTRIHIGNVDLARLCIKHAKEAPLSFTIDQVQRFQFEAHAGRPSTYAYDRLPVAGVLLLINKIQTVRDLTLNITTAASEYVLPLLASLETPILASFTLCDVITIPDDDDTHQGAPDTPEDLPLNIEGALIPTSSTMNPQRIECHNLLPFSPASFYTRLTHLEIVLTREPVNMAFRPITRFVHAAPALQWLCIDVCCSELLAMERSEATDTTGGNMDVTSNASAARTANLALTEIQLDIECLSDVTNVFNALDVPALQRVLVYVQSFGDNYVSVPGQLAGLPQTFVQTIRTAKIEPDRHEILVVATGLQDQLVSLRLPGGWLEAGEEMVRKVEEVFPLVSPCEIVWGGE